VKPDGIHLSDRFFLVVSFLFFLGVLATVFPQLTAVAIAAWPLLLILVVADRRRLPSAQGFSVTVDLPLIIDVGDPLFLTYSLHSPRGEIGNLKEPTLILTETETMRFQNSILPLKPNAGQLTAGVKALPRRIGNDQLRSVRVHFYSPAYFWFRASSIEVTNGRFRVSPSRTPVSEETFREVVHNQRLLYQGNRLTLRGQAKDQFHSIRRYQYPDSIRSIDAKKTARYQQLMTRVYDSFFSHHLILALDCGRSLCGDLKSGDKYDYYLSACLTLAENALVSRDRISFLAFSQTVHHLIRETRAPNRLLSLLEDRSRLRAYEQETNYGLLVPAVQRLAGSRSMLVILTDFTRPSVQEPLEKILPILCRKHLTVVIGLLDAQFSLNDQIVALQGREINLEDYGSLLYTYWLDQRTREFQSRLGSWGGAALMISEKQWLGVVAKLYQRLRQSTGL
jgi:uncharacterized protein (DUF58 family)